MTPHLKGSLFFYTPNRLKVVIINVKVSAERVICKLIINNIMLSGEVIELATW